VELRANRHVCSWVLHSVMMYRPWDSSNCYSAMYFVNSANEWALYCFARSLEFGLWLQWCPSSLLLLFLSPVWYCFGCRLVQDYHLSLWVASRKRKQHWGCEPDNKVSGWRYKSTDIKPWMVYINTWRLILYIVAKSWTAGWHFSWILYTWVNKAHYLLF